MKKQTILFAALLFFGVMNLYAPPGDPGGGPAGDPPVGDTAVPIDGGAVALLVAGVAYGAKKLKAKKLSQIQETEE